MSLEDRLVAAFRGLGIADDAPVGVACSGGADSVALAHLAASVRPRVVLLHVDHGLRETSAADATFVQRLAEEIGAGFASRRVDVDRRGSIEANARAARYAALTAMADDVSLGHVATAHTLDDQAETVVLRAMRGGSLDAIAPGRGMFVRPLLGMRRADLRTWLADRGAAWLEDPSNADLSIDRNWVRHVLLPQMRDRRGGVDLALARVADHTRADRAVLDGLARDVLASVRTDDIGALVPVSDVAPAVAQRVVRAACRAIGVELGDSDVDMILSSRSGRVKGLDVERIGDSVAIVRTDTAIAAPVELGALGGFEDAARGIRVRTSDGSSPAWRWRTVVDGGPLRIRPRVDGDRVRTTAGTRKVQDVLIDAKVPRVLRDLVGIVARGPDAVAVVGRTNRSEPSGTVIDVEPTGTSSWARELLWSR